jgi:hypothetical protein
MSDHTSTEETSLSTLMNDLFDFMSDSTNEKVRQYALEQGFLPILKSPTHITYLEQNELHRVVEILTPLTKDLSEVFISIICD